MPIPPERAAQYRPHVGKEELCLVFGPSISPRCTRIWVLATCRSMAQVDVTEPMGMETLVYFKINGSDICGRVNPKAGARDGAPLQLAADLNNMHIIDETTGLVV